ncbi:MAG: AbrB/MazE/SpoVT family DNA-binding domain-containing protein [Thermoproteota archaeon]|nr:AbrB/MazE/SpoVT family DNA-binding domain-containing protein [Candidatus Brockarchaeota archaeon]
MVKMSEKTVEIDKAGRIVIPAEWRKNWGRKALMVKLSDDEVLIKPLRKRGKLTDLADSIEIEKVSDFTDPHELRKIMYG